LPLKRSPVGTTTPERENLMRAIQSALGLALFAIVHTASAQTHRDEAFVGCFTLTYQEWGPSRIIGFPIGQVPAPGFLKLTVQLMTDSLRATDNIMIGWFADPPRTPGKADAYWRRAGVDSARVTIPLSPGLFGLVLTLGRTSTGFSGIASSYTDVVGREESTSRVVGIRVKCRGS
jgi:hypothetical protein